MGTLSNSKKWYERLKFHRLNNGRTQKELAQLLGVETRTVQRWEAGEVVPYASNQEEIGRVLGVEVEEIFNEDTMDQEEKDPG